MKYVKLSSGNIAIATVMPTSSWIDKKANRTFVDEGYIEVDVDTNDDNLLLHKFDSSDNSFTNAGVDSVGNKRWFDLDTGVLYEYTYNSDNQITGNQEVA